jgi:alginate O-acetyltransferase complex protein AlgJ
MMTTDRLLSIRAGLHVLIGAALFAIPILTLWNLGVERARPELKVALGRPLSGVTAAPPAPRWSWATLADGSLQRQIGTMIANAMPLRPLLIRLRNEFRYVFFGEYSSSELVAGRSSQMVMRDVIAEYCTRGPDSGPRMVRDAIPKLRAIQDYYQQRNRVFLFLVTPSKIAHMPEYFVDESTCASTPSNRAAKLPTLTRMLKEAGINYFDGASYVHALRGSYPVELFSLRALHWNMLATAHTAQALVAEINRIARRPLLPAFAFSYEVISRAQGTDHDLADLANLLVPRVWFPTPKLTYQPSAPCDFRSGPIIDVALVGSSFLGQLAETMVAANCIRQSNYYFYLIRARYAIIDNAHKAKLDLTDDDIAPIRNAEIVIVEENESFIDEGKYIEKLWNMLIGR